jgi:hypothetical protein
MGSFRARSVHGGRLGCGGVLGYTLDPSTLTHLCASCHMVSAGHHLPERMVLPERMFA